MCVEGSARVWLRIYDQVIGRLDLAKVWNIQKNKIRESTNGTKSANGKMSFMCDMFAKWRQYLRINDLKNIPHIRTDHRIVTITIERSSEVLSNAKIFAVCRRTNRLEPKIQYLRCVPKATTRDEKREKRTLTG